MWKNLKVFKVYFLLILIMCLIYSFNNIYFHLHYNKQSGNYEYDYYVMQWMSTIVRAKIDREIGIR